MDDDPAGVRAAMEYQVEQGRFVSMAVLDVASHAALLEAGDPRQLDDPLAAVPDHPATDDFDDQASTIGHLHILNLIDGATRRIGYLHRPDAEARIALYAEVGLPEDPIAPIPPGEAFSGLDYALYLGPDEQASALTRASTADLPLSGRRAEETVPFGDTVLTIVMSPTGTLGSGLLAGLPWIVAVVGVVGTVGGTALIESVHDRRRQAEELARQSATLYAREHEIASTLQRSLLPQAMPAIDGFDLAARYYAGATGTEVGGDWYDVVQLDHDRITVIIGDVAGRGVKAAAVMAAMRYAGHTLAAEGSNPGRLLTTINQLDSIRGDFVTMACATVDATRASIELAKAGHPAPLLVDGERTRFLDVRTGPPIGFLPDSLYQAETLPLPRDAVLLFYTDGLYERRGEDIDDGLARLR